MVFVIRFADLLHARRASTEQRKGTVFLGWENLEADLCAMDLWVSSAQSSLGDSAEQQAALEAAP